MYYKARHKGQIWWLHDESSSTEDQLEQTTLIGHMMQTLSSSSGRIWACKLHCFCSWHSSYLKIIGNMLSHQLFSRMFVHNMTGSCVLLQRCCFRGVSVIMMISSHLM